MLSVLSWEIFYSACQSKTSEHFPPEGLCKAWFAKTACVYPKTSFRLTLSQTKKCKPSSNLGWLHDLIPQRDCILRQTGNSGGEQHPVLETNRMACLESCRHHRLLHMTTTGHTCTVPLKNVWTHTLILCLAPIIQSATSGWFDGLESTLTSRPEFSRCTARLIVLCAHNLSSV